MASKWLGVFLIVISYLFVSGCEDQYYRSPNAGCFKKNFLGEIWQSPNCDGNWNYLGMAGFTKFDVDQNGNIYKQQGQDDKAAQLLTSGLLGMAASGALNNTNNTPQQNLAVQGAASGLQNYNTNEAIRNSGQSNVNASYGQDNQSNQQQSGQVNKPPIKSTFLINVGDIAKNVGIAMSGWYDLNKDGTMNIDTKEVSLKNSFVDNEVMFLVLWFPPNKSKLRYNLFEKTDDIKLMPEDIIINKDGIVSQEGGYFQYILVNAIRKNNYPNGVQGLGKYEIRSYLNDDAEPFAIRAFEINWDLSAEQVYK